MFVCLHTVYPNARALITAAAAGVVCADWCLSISNTADSCNSSMETTHTFFTQRRSVCETLVPQK